MDAPDTITHTSDPVIVFGAARSGTTLFRLILNGHENVNNPGEADFLFDHLHRDASHPTGWRYNLDQLRQRRIFRSHNLDIPEGLDGVDLLHHFFDRWRSRSPGILSLNMHRNAPRMALLMPNARFIHILRDPRDVARSTIGMGWAGTSYHGVSNWISTETGWDKAEISPDQVFTVRFEDLMTDLEQKLRQVCRFIGVTFSRNMLVYPSYTSYAAPDPSISQQWRHKASPHEIALIEGRCGALLEARGYTPNGAPAFLSPREKLQLDLTNTFNRWSFNIRRYGLPLFISTNVARRTGPRWLYHKLRLKMDERVTEVLR